MTAATTDTDPCAGCGLPDVLDAPDTDQVAAHWDTPLGHDIVAWTCSEPCRAKVEARRDATGRLR